MVNKNTDTVTVRKKRLEKIINYISTYTSDCSDCPVCDVCDNYETCTEAFRWYMKGESIITGNEARQALKTIAQYCDDVDCYECEIKDACEGIEAQPSPFCRLSEIVRKEGGKP